MPKNSEDALAELERRWRSIFGALAAGGEVPPATRLRAEGYMQALVDLEIASEQGLNAALETCYRDCFGESLPAGWRELQPFPEVPGFGRRAPVYPSTRD